MSVGVGDVAPGFAVEGFFAGERSSYSLETMRGQPVVLVFYPGDDTPVCTRQLTSYTDDIDQFADAGAAVWGISPQGLDSHEKFACRRNLGFPLLADEDKAVHEAYGCLGPLGFPRRSVFVVDADGVIRYAHRAVAGARYRPSRELIAAVREATA